MKSTRLLKTVGALLFLILFAAIMLIANRQWKADVAGRRPKSDYKDYEQLSRAYGGEVQEGYGCDFRFVKAIVSLPKQKCDDAAYSGWKRTEAPDAESPYTYEKDDILFGCNAHYNVGVDQEKGRHVACFITLTEPEGADGNVYKVFRELWEANIDGVGIANTYYLDRKESTQEIVTKLMEDEVSDRDIAFVWPKKAMAWMIMVDYRIVDGKPMLEIRAL